jgi:hypothetical protein
LAEYHHGRTEIDAKLLADLLLSTSALEPEVGKLASAARRGLKLTAIAETPRQFRCDLHSELLD